MPSPAHPLCRFVALSAALLTVGCADSDGPAPFEEEAPDIGAAPDAPTAPPRTLAPCEPERPTTCLYRPAETWPVNTSLHEDLTYTDLTGAERAVHVAIHRPPRARGRLL